MSDDAGVPDVTADAPTVDGGDAATWRVIGEGLRRGLVSVWGTSSSDVWAVGGDDGQGDGPLVVHYDGSSFTRLETGATGTLWWVFGRGPFDEGPVYLGGEGGLILRYAGEEFETIPTPATTTVFGIWGTGDQVWAAGGELEGSTGAQIWRLEGDAFVVPKELPILKTAALFKVWGCDAEDVWFVGTGGTVIHWDGKAFATSDSNANGRTLFTVHVEPGTCLAAAVGGYGSGEIIEHAGSGWTNVTPSGIFATNGVWLTSGGGVAVGIQGQTLARIDGVWQVEPTPPERASFFLHGTWMDSDGGAWAVGAMANGFPTNDGVLIYRGDANVAALSDS